MAKPLDIDIVKRPHSTDSFTEKQLLDLMECVEDPIFFARSFVKIQHPLKGAVPFELYEFQERMIKAFHEHRFTVALTGRQLGKALALDTPIPTPTGWTTMGDIKVGDHVLGADGMPTRVDFITDAMYGHAVYEVEFDNGEVIKADAEHLWRIGSNLFPGADPKLLTTTEIIPWLRSGKAKGQGVYIATTDALVLPAADLPIPPYTLGVWLGDGEAAAGRFCGHKDDVGEIREHIEADGFVTSEQKADKRNNVRYQTIYGLQTALNDQSLYKNKRIPVSYLRGSQEQRLALLQGLMDTDGYADPSGGFEFYQKDRGFAEQVAELISSLGMKPRLRSKTVNGEIYWRVRFAMTDGHPKNHRFYIKDIREIPSVPVKCIRVENEDHMFLCGRSMIPTHNTTTAAAYLLWQAMFRPDTTILIVANKLVQALEIMDRIRYAYENLPDYIRAGVIEYNKGTIAFDNGSKIVSRATSADAGRGLSITTLYADEFAFVAPNKSSEFWTSIQPVLSTGGSCIITSTPKSDEDQFAQIWKGAIDNVDDYGNPSATGEGKNGFFPIKVPWWEHPDRDEEWAKPFRESLGEARFRQEFECDFVTSDETLVDPLTLTRLAGKKPEFYTGTVRWFRDVEANRTYAVALDPSVGTGSDPAAIQVFQLPEMVQVAEWQHNRTDARGQVRTLMQILNYIDETLRDDIEQIGEPDIYFSVENNTIGETILQIIEDTGEERFPGIFLSERKRKGQVRRFRKGFNTDNRKKLAGCARLKSLIESGRLTVNSSQLIKQLKSFVRKESSYSAKPGEHDDLVMALVLFVRMMDSISLWSGMADLKEIISDEELYDEPMPVSI